MWGIICGNQIAAMSSSLKIMGLNCRNDVGNLYIKGVVDLSLYGIESLYIKIDGYLDQVDNEHRFSKGGNYNPGVNNFLMGRAAI